MPQILVWKCPRSNELFESIDEYVLHLKSVARKNLADKNYKKNTKKCLEEFSKFTNVEDLFSELPQLIIKHYNKINNKNIKCEFSIKYRLDYSESCSNSHATYRGGKTNWCGKDKDLPTSYQGLRGRISFHFPKEKSYYIYDEIRYLIQYLGIHTGTGGGGTKELSYDVILFRADWPNISEMNVNDIKSIIE